MVYGVLGFLAAGGMGYFFYHSWMVLPMGVAGCLVCWRLEEKALCEKRKEKLAQEFKSLIEAVSANLQAGSSVENAFLRGEKDLLLLYEEKADIIKEIRNLKYLMENNVMLEEILLDFGRRSGMADIRSFAEVFSSGKRSGGDFREIIRSCVNLLSQKMDTEREIRTLLHAKALEQKVMCVVPFAVMGYVQMTSPDYFTPLYHNPAGIITMTLCLSVYLGAVFAGMQIVRIEV